MKKIILLFLFLLFITGCKDYNELENLAYITSIGIDYTENNEYVVTFEILNNKKENDKVIYEAYTVSSKAKTITDAFLNTNKIVNANPYFAHVELLIIDKNIAYNNLEKIKDFILREKEIRENLYLCITDNAKELLNTKIEPNQVISEAITKLFEQNKYEINNITKVSFFEFVSNTENLNKSNIVPYIKTNDNNIIMNTSLAFNKYKATTILDEQQNYLYSLFQNKNNTYYISTTINDQVLETGIRFEKIKYEIDNNNINIRINALGKLVDNDPNITLRNNDGYKQINQIISKHLNNDINKFIEFIKNNNIDILGFKHIYKSKYKKDIDNINNLNIKINIDFSIDKKGISYESK